MATRMLCGPRWRCLAHIITHCWRAFPRSRMCSRRGCFWFTASAWANYMARVVEPQMAAAFCQRHDAGVWECLCNSPHISRARGRRGQNCFHAFCFGKHWVAICLSWDTPAFWASWGDTLPVIVGRRPRVARQLVAELEHLPPGRRDGASSAHWCHGI